MKTKQDILAIIKDGKKSECLDGRDYGRLADFFDVSDWPILGFEPKEGVSHIAKELTRENVLECLRGDLDFAFSKALDQRGISAGLMYQVVKMWMWVLDDDLQYCDEYAQYGLPLLKKVAVKYGLPNPIGEDYGNEYKYSCEYGA